MNRQSPSDKLLPTYSGSAFSARKVRGDKSSSLLVTTIRGKQSGDVLKNKKMVSQNKKSVVYTIPCCKCPRVYYVWTEQEMEPRIREHKEDLR